MQETRTIVTKVDGPVATGAGAIMRVVVVAIALLIAIPLLLIGLLLLTLVLLGALLVWGVRRVLGGGRGSLRVQVARTDSVAGGAYAGALGAAEGADADRAGADAAGRENVRVRRSE